MNRNNRFQFEEIEIHIENWMKRKKSELTSNITHCVCFFFTSISRFHFVVYVTNHFVHAENEVNSNTQ